MWRRKSIHGAMRIVFKENPLETFMLTRYLCRTELVVSIVDSY